MGWEFGRKTGPSENVMVPATTDPFEGPKWAAPVLHMPPVLVLLVNLIQAGLRGAFFLARHPIPVLTVAGLGWLTWAFGWQAPALLGGLVLVAAGGWATVDYPSFLAGVARPLRAWWRRVRVYRANWAPVMVMSGLAFYRNAHEYLPTIKRVICTPTTDRVLVKMLSGQAPSIWEDHSENLAHGFGSKLCRVRTADKPGHVWLEFVRTDSLKCPLAALSLPETSAGVDLAALPVGRCEDGSVYRMRLASTHVLIAGATDAGKGSFQWGLVRALLPAVRDGWVSLWGLDPKRMELAFGRKLFNRYSDDPSGGMVKLLEEAVAVMQERAARFGGRTRTFTATTDDPFIVIIIDELAFLTAYSPDRDLRKRADAAIATLTSQGRSVGVCVVGALQDPRKDVISIRNLFPTRIALRLDEADQVDMVLGEGARDRGAHADLISPVTAIGAGVGFVRPDGTPDPVRVRAGFVSDSDIHAMVAYLHPHYDSEPVPIEAAS